MHIRLRIVHAYGELIVFHLRVDQVFSKVKKINKRGIAMMMVE